MIVCPNCNHQNPDGAVQCEACYTPLPAMMSCPNCGASVQADASFCGQCGTNLKAVAVGSSTPDATFAPSLNLPDPVVPDPLIPPDPLVAGAPAVPEETAIPPSIAMGPPPSLEQQRPVPPSSPPGAAVPPPMMPPITPPSVVPSSSATRLQTQVARLLHVQTNTLIELPQQLLVIHLGKPNDRIPPDVDVSGFPDSEIVSRIHADIRIEGDAYYLEDVGSSNGTYINNTPLPPGNRHRLRPGDRIALGKGDKVSFLFQLS